MHTFVAEKLREIVSFINKNGIKKDQIVLISKEDNQYTLLYYGREE